MVSFAYEYTNTLRTCKRSSTYAYEHRRGDLSSRQLVQAMPDRLSTRSDDSVLQLESNSINLVELLRQFSPRGYGHVPKYEC